ncbi:MAG TPA: tetratricopeptide repeat protein [Chitinophagaceae bacterium]|nr:tetratricopeptide repeat protein [Chitinophagaceae bacterium]
MKYLLSLMFWIAATFSKAQPVDAIISKGNEQYRQQQYALAEAQYKAALEKAPDNGTAQFNLANALYQQKKWGEAHGVFKKLAAAASGNALKEKAVYNNGVIYTKEKALDRSIEAYKEALRLAPDDNDARENLQKALLEQKRKQQQKKDQEKKQQKNSNMSQKEAEQKLKLLQEKEKRLQERLQKGGQKGNSQPKDW